MKRVDNLFEKLISDENLSLAIDEVNKTHHWKTRHRPNKCTAWVIETKEERIRELRKIIINGFEPKPAREVKRWDASAQKWRNINEPVQFPDQYIHHALIQVLQPVFMRGMDEYCCGSIRGRGPHKAVNSIKNWLKNDYKGTKYEFCADIYHFYESLSEEVVMNRMRQLIKDAKILDLIKRILTYGVKIGFYTSQWFANTVLQPLDQLIRQSGLCSYYVRYMDNFTIFGSNKRKLLKLKNLITEWLKNKNLELKGNWQIFPISKDNEKVMLSAPRRGFQRSGNRLPDAVGYRYGRGYIIPRKHNLIRIKRAIARYRYKIRNKRIITFKNAASLISRLGQLVHCNNYNLYKYLYNGERIVHSIKNIIRIFQKKEALTWNTYLEHRARLKSSKQKVLLLAT